MFSALWHALALSAHLRTFDHISATISPFSAL